jgi:hypothetical protein
LPKRTISHLSKLLCNSFDFFFASEAQPLGMPADTKIKLFQCFSKLPVSAYRSKLVKLLHHVCEHIALVDSPCGAVTELFQMIMESGFITKSNKE